MKKLMLALGLLLMISCVTFADGVKTISNQTVYKFTKQFADARDVNWQMSNNMSVAVFSLQGQILQAYYNDHSRLVAVVHNIAVDHLPIFLHSNLKKNFSAYWITSLSEVATSGTSSYQATLENAEEILVLKSTNSNEWVVKKIVHKDVA